MIGCHILFGLGITFDDVAELKIYIVCTLVGDIMFVSFSRQNNSHTYTKLSTARILINY